LNAYYAFNTTSAVSTDKWESAGSTYTSGTANSTAALTSNISGQNSQRGEWLQIQSSLPVVMYSYSFTSNDTITRLPKTFWIVGSNDGTNWYQIQTASCGATQYSSGLYTMSSTFLVNSASAQTSGSATLTTTTNGSYTTSAYTYFRLIVQSIFGTAETLVDIGEWNITFNPSTSTGPSRTLLYMDASNINQLDVSGSLALVNSNASSMIVSPNTTSATSSIWQNNNVTWVASESNPLSGNLPYKAFNLTYSDSAAVTWSYSSGAYVGNAGNSAVTTQTTNILSPGPGNVNGDWIQIQSSIPLVMKNYQFATGGLANQLPKTFWIVGSNDGSTWYPIQNCSFNTQPSSTNSALISGVVTVGAASSTVGSATLTTSTPSTMTNAYTYFRLIALTLCATSGSNNLEIGEWLINFTPASSAVSLALDPATPNQLNIGGSLGIAGGITPMYSTPSFSAGQVGQVYSLTAYSGATSFSTGGNTILQQTNLPVGVWLFTWNLTTNTAGGYWQTSLFVNTTSNTIGGLWFGVPVAGAAANNLVSQLGSWVYTNTSSTTTLGLFAQGNQAFSIYGIGAQLTRIA
jgi:hypothetical protein